MIKIFDKVHIFMRDRGVHIPINKTMFNVLRHLFKPTLTHCFSKEIKKNSVVVDIGANLGYYSILASKLVGKEGKVYSFEPESTNYGKLLKNATSNKCKNVTALKKAVGNKTEKIKLYIHPNDRSDHQTFDSGEGREVVEIESVDLDNFFVNSLENSNVDFIKMDIQGFEGFALQGMQSTLNNPHLKMIIEFGPRGLRKAGTDPKELLTSLKDKGFNFYIVDKKGNYNKQNNIEEILTITEKVKYVDIFCKKN